MSVRHDNDISIQQFLKRYFNYGRGNALNQYLLNLNNEDCCFQLYDNKCFGAFFFIIKQSWSRFKTQDDFIVKIMFSLLNIVRFVTYECGGIYEKLKK
jgi:hypothetical protein